MGRGACPENLRAKNQKRKKLWACLVSVTGQCRGDSDDGGGTKSRAQTCRRRRIMRVQGPR